MHSTEFNALQILIAGEAVGAAPLLSAQDGDWGRFTVDRVTASDADAAVELGGRDVLLASPGWHAWSRHVDQRPVVLVVDACTAEQHLTWLAAGAQDVLTPDTLAGPDGHARVRAAIERYRRTANARPAHATDVLTGLPHERQLVEHMSHLLALREREPAPMALIVARIEGLATATARFGEPAAAALRRKLAVRLRGAVRASDVVATIGEASFAVLLSSIDSPADTGTVERKLRAALGDTFSVSGTDVAVAVALGVAGYPSDGDQPGDLLRRAVGLAATAPALGRLGHVNAIERAGDSGPPAAANDD